MNLLLVEPGEVADDATVALADRRAEHLRRIVGVTIGQTIRAGIVGGKLGTAEVSSDDGTTMILRLSLTAPASLPLPIELVLAMPRPKVLTRVIETAAAFGVARIDLTNAWRVDKSYLASPRLAHAALAYALRFGAEQGATTHVPPLAIHDRFMGLVDSRWPSATGGTPATRLLAHPGAPPIEQAALTWPLAVAIGPEGGWIQREIDTFVERGFTAVSIGAPILRVEAALSATLGQLLLLQRRTDLGG
ncbi:MAG: 16S rRNA (uracil(1498)-N(3))-methyltransferase [Deltaproteobacteria bacterium]|nr:16S rRNA (uracil(1498)-N(3))-methyltransferase [Deltaproteobacteria bacterium]